MNMRWHGLLFGVLSMVLMACGEVVTASTPVDGDIAELPIATELATLTEYGHGEECPHIIQKRVDTTSVVRSDSLRQNICEYFVYPNVGDRLGVELSDSRIQATLQSPHLHDFANGDYLVKSQGRHVIRLEYDAFGHKPDHVNYDIVVDIRSVK